MATDPRVTAEQALSVLEAVPALTNGARAAVERHKDAIETLRDIDGPLRSRLGLRTAELTHASGGFVAAGLLCTLVRADELDAARRARLAFLSARLVAQGPEGWPAPLLDTDGSPLGAMRADTVRAEAAARHARPALARESWLAVIDGQATGLEADELRYAALTWLARRHLLDQRPALALPLLDRAARIAATYGAARDEAGLHMWTYEALLQLDERNAMYQLARRADGLPRADVGGLPRHLVIHLLATEQADDGDTEAAVRTLEEGIREIHPGSEPDAWGALNLAKAVILEAAGRDYQVFRTCVLARNRLKRSGADPAAGRFDPVVDALRARVGDEAWDAFVERLKAEIRSMSTS